MRVDDEVVREPHRHDYHELIWVLEGTRRAPDRRRAAAGPGQRTVTIIGRGQVHVFREARSRAAASCASPTSCWPAASGSSAAGCSAVAAAARSRCRTGVLDRLDALLGALPTRRPGPPTPTAPTSSATCSRRCCCGSSAGTTRHAPSAATPTTPRSSCTAASRSALEADFAGHHDAAHYADALGVPAAALSKSLSELTGPLDQGADHRPRDARGGAAAALHRPDGRRDRVPDRLRRPALLLACVQARTRDSLRRPTATRARGKSMHP